MSKISPWVFTEIQKVKNENKKLLHRNSVLEAKIEQLERAGSSKKHDDLEQPAQPTSLANPEENISSNRKLNQEIKALRHLLDQSQEMRTQQMEFIRKIRNSCQRFTWSNQTVADSFEESVALYLKGGNQQADSQQRDFKRSQLGFRKQLESIQERVSKRMRTSAPQESILQEFEKQETPKKRGPKGPRKKKLQQENSEEVMKVFNVYRDKASISKYFAKNMEENIETEVKVKRRPGRPSKKEIQEREEAQRRLEQKMKRGKELKERLIKKFKEVKFEEEQKAEVELLSEEESPQIYELEKKKEHEKSGREESIEEEIAIIQDEEHNTTFQEENENISEQEVDLDSEEKS